MSDTILPVHLAAMELSKHYTVVHLEGFKGYLRHLVGRSPKIKIHALDGVSLKINKGEKVGLIGLNGAGKSTLIKCLTGILRPSSGRTSLFGRDSYKYRNTNNFQIGVVFGQRCQLRWDLSSFESYRLLSSIYRLPRNFVKNNIERVSSLLDLGSFLHQPVRQLSLGQKMRSELAGALLHNPELLLLDEPTLGLDLLTKDRIQQILKESPQTMLIASHDVSDIEEICDRIILLHKGKILFDDHKNKLSSILNVPEHVIFECVSENISFDESALSGTQIRLVRMAPHEVEFEIPNEEDLSRLLEYMVHHHPFTDFKRIRSDLKQVIRKVYGRIS